jgi:hypothetical protein
MFTAPPPAEAEAPCRLGFGEERRNDDPVTPHPSTSGGPRPSRARSPLDTVRRRAEGAGASPLRNVLEALLWLAAFVPGAAAAHWTLTRERWRLPLVLGLCSEAVLLALTFLFPPSWLRAGLDVGLWSAMLWAASRSEGVPTLGALPEDRSRS